VTDLTVEQALRQERQADELVSHPVTVSEFAERVSRDETEKVQALESLYSVRERKILRLAAKKVSSDNTILYDKSKLSREEKDLLDGLKSLLSARREVVLDYE